MWGSLWDEVTGGKKKEGKKVKSTTRGSTLSGYISGSSEECFYKKSE